MNSLEFLDDNLQALKGHCPYTLEWLNEQSVDLTAVKKAVHRRPDGMLDWCFSNGKHLFDKLVPSQVYKDWTFEANDGTSVTIIVGCNLGYGINRVLEGTQENHKVVVLEPRPDLLLACLGQTDYRHFFRHKRLFFIPPKYEFLRKAGFCLDLHYVFGGIRVFADLPSQQLGPEYARWTDKWKAVLEDVACDVKTLRRGQDTMVENELKNFTRAMQDGSLVSLKDQGAGVSVVLLGAGPSLAEFGPLLADHPGSALYGCGLQTLPALQRLGLKPHICMAIDYSRAMNRVYDELDTSWAADIPLIYSCKVRPEVVAAYPGPTLPLWTAGGLATHMSRQRDVVMASGKSVGVTLTRFFIWCGAKRLVLVGHDFSWFGESTHVAGHLSQDKGFQFDPKRHQKYINDDGATIYSSLAYTTALRELEMDLEESTTPVFNLFGGGMSIKGSRTVTWQELQDRRLLDSEKGTRERFCQALSRARFPRSWPRLESKASSWARSLRFARKRLRRLFKRPAKNQEELHQLLTQILIFLRQDPLYQPYLYNEIMDLAGLVHAQAGYGLRDWTVCKSILKKVVRKVREVDRYLVLNPATA